MPARWWPVFQERPVIRLQRGHCLCKPRAVCPYEYHLDPIRRLQLQMQSTTVLFLNLVRRRIEEPLNVRGNCPKRLLITATMDSAWPHHWSRLLRYAQTVPPVALVLTCVSHTAHVIDIGWTSVCPSVWLSVRHTLVLCRNGLTYRQTVFTPGIAPWF